MNITITQIADAFGYDSSTIRRWVKEDNIPTKTEKVGRGRPILTVPLRCVLNLAHQRKILPLPNFATDAPKNNQKK